LTRLLHSEGDWADFICFLTECDPEPLRTLLELAKGNITFHREYAVDKSRLDGLICLQGQSAEPKPVAVLEFKLGASLHGDQLTRYARWAEQNTIASLFLIGPDDKRLPQTPSKWNTKISLPDMLKSWARTSKNRIAKCLAERAKTSFDEIENMAMGPACDSFGQVPDAMRIRRLYAMTKKAGEQASVKFWGERSQSGFPNFAATWYNNKTKNSVTCEIQRINRGKGNFELRLMVGDKCGTLKGSERIATDFKGWLSWGSLKQNLSPCSKNVLSCYKGSEFKTGSTGRGSKKFYGYEGVGQGSRFIFSSNATLNDMVLVAKGVLQYMATFPG
jgi:hypothetical protein